MLSKHHPIDRYNLKLEKNEMPFGEAYNQPTINDFPKTKKSCTATTLSFSFSLSFFRVYHFYFLPTCEIYDYVEAQHTQGNSNFNSHSFFPVINIKKSALCSVFLRSLTFLLFLFSTTS